MNITHEAFEISNNSYWEKLEDSVRKQVVSLEYAKAGKAKQQNAKYSSFEKEEYVRIDCRSFDSNVSLATLNEFCTQHNLSPAEVILKRLYEGYGLYSSEKNFVEKYNKEKEILHYEKIDLSKMLAQSALDFRQAHLYNKLFEVREASGLVCAELVKFMSKQNLDCRVEFDFDRAKNFIFRIILSSMPEKITLPKLSFARVKMKRENR